MNNENQTVNAEYVKPPKKPMSNKKINAIKSLLMSSFIVFIAITYVILGLFLAWSPYWLIFLLIPIYGSLIEAILRKNPRIFSIEMLAVAVFVTIGFITKIWHPTWVVFLIIPVYRSTLSAFRKIKYIKEAD